MCALGLVPKIGNFCRGGGYKRILRFRGNRRRAVGNWCGWGRLRYVRRRQGLGFLLVCLDLGLELGGDYSGGLLRRVCRRFLGVSVGGGFWVENWVDWC